MRKFRQDGFYRLLWNEDARKIRFTWHRTVKGAETIPPAYRYDPNRGISSDYYHHRCVGAHGLAKFAKEAEMRIDWQEGYLISPRDTPYHLCPPDTNERATDEVLAQESGKLTRLRVEESRSKFCPVCGERYDKFKGAKK